MTRVAIQSFDDPDRYFSAIRAMKGTGFVLPRRGAFEAKLTQLDFGRVWLQSGSETLARSGHMSVDHERRPIGFLADESVQPVTLSGAELPVDHIAFFSPGATQYQRSFGSLRWSAMSLAPEDLEEASRRVADQVINVPSSTRYIGPPAAQLARLRRLHREAVSLAESSSPVLRNSVAAIHIESDLTHAMISCLTVGEEKRFHRAWYRHKHIMDRFEQWVDAHPDRPAHLLEVCADIGISARSLTLCCQEQLGMSPVRYLWMRRMKLARRALQEAGPSTTVTVIALSYGFSHLGRFSVGYRSLFGELPSATLAQWPKIGECIPALRKTSQFARTG
ncbi:MAG TPA: AraC family transcriptional regulator [Geobacterales bacterium]|nr:AraC family transcriptional regulator [Geobacterales bacterium]